LRPGGEGKWRTAFLRGGSWQSLHVQKNRWFVLITAVAFFATMRGAMALKVKPSNAKPPPG
jgi:hypothetical protein